MLLYPRMETSNCVVGVLVQVKLTILLSVQYSIAISLLVSTKLFFKYSTLVSLPFFQSCIELHRLNRVFRIGFDSGTNTHSSAPFTSNINATEYNGDMNISNGSVKPILSEAPQSPISAKIMVQIKTSKTTTEKWEI